MFTGIVDHMGSVLNIESNQNKAILWIASQFSDFVLGESISVDGVCLSVVDTRVNQFTVQVSPETLSLTIIPDYQIGQCVNLERAMRLGGRLGGHVVSGHVDTYFRVKEIESVNEYCRMRFQGEKKSELSYLIKKGSVAVNGVSLTINNVFDDGFDVMLIPHTLERTNLSQLKLGSRINIEFDQMAKMIAQQCQTYLAQISKEVKHA